MGRLKKNEYKCSTVAAWAPTDSEAAMRDDIEEDVCVTKLEVDTAMSKMLRIMLGNSSNQPIIHSTLRSKALAGAEGELRYVPYSNRNSQVDLLRWFHAAGELLQKPCCLQRLDQFKPSLYFAANTS